MRKICNMVLVVGLCLGLVGCSKKQVKFIEEIVIEYGDKEVDKTKLLTEDEINEDVEIIEVKNFDGMKIGMQEVNVSYRKSGKETLETETVKIEIKDTKAPEIKFSNEPITLEQGTEFEPKDVITVNDPIDGEIVYNEDAEAKTDAWHYDSDVDINTVGEYKITVLAYDKNGNESKAELSVSVIEKQEEYVYDDNGNYVANPNYVPVTYGNHSSQGSNSTSENSESTYTPPVEPSIPSEPVYTPPVDTPSQPKLCPGGQYDEYMPCDYIPEYLGAGVKGVDWFYTEADCLKKVNELGGVSVGYGWGSLDGMTNGWETIWVYEMQYH